MLLALFFHSFPALARMQNPLQDTYSCRQKLRIWGFRDAWV